MTSSGKAYITGTSAFLPNAPVDNEAIENVLGMIAGKPARAGAPTAPRRQPAGPGRHPARETAVRLGARAAQLSKSDLVSEMVLEFDELQGVMGSYYALNDGEDPAVAQALTEQYLPRQAGDALAQGKVCLLYTSPSPRDRTRSRMPSSA